MSNDHKPPFQPNETIFRALIDNTAEIIGVTDLDGNVTYLNKAGYELLGISRSEDAFVHASKYFVPFDSAIMAEQAKQTLMDTGKWEGERLYRHFITGDPVPVYLNAFLINDANTGKPTAMASVARDLRPEKIARAEQNKLLTLIEHTSDCVILADTDHNITYLNAAGKELFGIQGDEYLDKKNVDILMPESVGMLNSTINKSIEKNGRWTGQLHYRHFVTGEAIPVQVTSMLVHDPVTGKSLGRVILAHDLRREIADKRALVESEQLLQNITTAAPISLWMSDAEGNITYANQTWADWTDQSLEETLGTGWLNALLPDDRDRAARKFRADLEARRPCEVNYRILSKSGDLRWCKATGNPQYSADGDFTGYIGACADVTEKTLAEQQLFLKNEELNDQIKQFEFVNGFMPVQLWTAGTSGDLDYVNDRTLDYFGTDMENVIGPAWILRVHPQDREGCIDAWTHSLRTGDAYQFEFRLKDKNGIYKWHLARALPFISDGKIVKWFGTNTDIDDQKQLQRQKDDFLGIASHELKTPVTSIKAYAQVLGAMLTKEGELKKAGMVERMDAQVNRLTALITDLLDVTKINSGKLQFNKGWFDINQIVDETVNDLQHTTQKHTLVKKLGEVQQLYADKERISQVLTNFITNAVKYSPNANEVIITTSQHNAEVLVSVKDHGIGIPADKTQYVFDQFYRVSGDKQHTFPGLGLGLYISAEIIKREGGRIWVESEEGNGSDFCFALPVGKQQELAEN